MMLTDTDIKRMLGSDILIDPYDETNLTPVGYDFSVGDFAYSLQSGVLEPDQEKYNILPGQTVLVLTKEYLWVSDRIGGTFHSKVSLVSKGFSPISTTLDPNWSGQLLIAITNYHAETLTLTKGQPFVTLVLYLTRSRATKPHNKPPRRQDIVGELLASYARASHWQQQIEADLNQRITAMVSKFVEVFGDSQGQSLFEQRIRATSSSVAQRVRQTRQQQLRRLVTRYGTQAGLWLLLILLLTLPLYFNFLMSLLSVRGLTYDSQVVAGRITAIVVVVLALTRRLG